MIKVQFPNRTIFWLLLLFILGGVLLYTRAQFSAKEGRYQAYVGAQNTLVQLRRRAKALKNNLGAEDAMLAPEKVKRALLKNYCGKRTIARNCKVEAVQVGRDIVYHVVLSTPYLKRTLRHIRKKGPVLRGRIHALSIQPHGQEGVLITVQGMVGTLKK